MSGSSPAARLGLAIELMEEALRLLVAADTVAEPLQEAIGNARRLLKPSMAGLENEDYARLPPPLNAALVRAMGGALGILATLLQRGGLTTVEDFGNMLGVYAVVSGENSADEGDILGCWAGIIDQVSKKGIEDTAH